MIAFLEPPEEEADILWGEVRALVLTEHQWSPFLYLPLTDSPRLWALKALFYGQQQDQGGRGKPCLCSLWGGDSGPLWGWRWGGWKPHLLSQFFALQQPCLEGRRGLCQCPPPPPSSRRAWTVSASIVAVINVAFFYLVTGCPLFSASSLDSGPSTSSSRNWAFSCLVLCE